MGKAKEDLERKIPLLNSIPGAREQMDLWPKVIQLELEGEEGPFFMVVEKGQARLEEGFPGPIDIVISGDGQEFVRVLVGEEDISQPIAHGRIKITRGMVKEVMPLSRILGYIARR
jgi:putative sterol carrier protein